MTNVLYPSGKAAFLRGDIDWEADTIVAAFIDDTYVYNASHDDYSDVSAFVLASAMLTGCTVLSTGVADADDLSLSPANGTQVAGIIIAVSGGTLIAFMDQNDDTTPISVAADGNPIPVAWSASASRVFAIL